MLHFLPATLRGAIAGLILFCQTLLLVPILVALALLKLLIPIDVCRVFFTRACIVVAETWIAINSGWMHLTQKTDWDVQLPQNMSKDIWYLVTSNHQSWADIVILQHLFNKKIPMIKFFLKQQLIWVPIIGLAWWALDFPFMKRYSNEFLRKHPEKKGQDLATTRKACEKFKTTPVTVFNFLEGTRFTEGKHNAQQSPFKNLLKPKAGGIGFVLGAMGEQLGTLLNVTILYPEYSDGTRPGFWDFLCGNIQKVVVRVDQQAIPEEFLGGDYINDDNYREQFQLWVNQLWQEKDQLLDELQKQQEIQ